MFGWLVKTLFGSSDEVAAAPVTAPETLHSTTTKRPRPDDGASGSPSTKVAKSTKGKKVVTGDFDEMMDKITSYATRSGSLDDIMEEQPALGKWLRQQNSNMDNLTLVQVAKIKKIDGMIKVKKPSTPKPVQVSMSVNKKSPRAPRQSMPKFDIMFDRLKAFKKVYGHTRVAGTYEDGQLANWARRMRLVRAQQERGAKSKISVENVKKLNDIDFAWKLPRGRPRKNGTPNSPAL